MDERQEKGRLLAHNKRIKHVDGALWFVPSQTANDGGYIVNLQTASCSCPDHETRRVKCKHQFAVEFRKVIETAPDGSQTMTETVKITRKTYAQDWPNYNAAQCTEKRTALILLKSLCDGIVTPPHPGRGPKPILLSDAVYGMTTKVYSGMSGRRATTDLKMCADAGHMTRAPKYNTIFECFNKPEMTPLLTTLIEESAAPLVAVETQFAVDSTCFTLVPYKRYFDIKYGTEKKEHTSVKAHAAVGTFTNVLTAVPRTPSSPDVERLLARDPKRGSIKGG